MLTFLSGVIVGFILGFIVAWGGLYLIAWMLSGHFYEDLASWKKKFLSWLK